MRYFSVMRWMLVLVAACASSHEEKPAATPELARSEPAPAKAAGDPDEGGQVAQPQAAAVGAINPGPRPDGGVHARIAPGNARIEGKIDEAEVTKTIRRGLGQLRACADSGMKRNPSLSGLLVLQFTIAPTGHVADAHVVTHLDDDVDSCVLAHVRRFQFPKPEKDPVAVMQSFNVSPQ
jgi:hypothetical protein